MTFLETSPAPTSRSRPYAARGAARTAAITTTRSRIIRRIGRPHAMCLGALCEVLWRTREWSGAEGGEGLRPDETVDDQPQGFLK